MAMQDQDGTLAPLAQVLRGYRALCGVSRRWAAQDLALSHLTRLEAGEARPSVEGLRRISGSIGGQSGRPNTARWQVLVAAAAAQWQGDPEFLIGTLAAPYDAALVWQLATRAGQFWHAAADHPEVKSAGRGADPDQVHRADNPNEAVNFWAVAAEQVRLYDVCGADRWPRWAEVRFSAAAASTAWFDALWLAGNRPAIELVARATKSHPDLGDPGTLALTAKALLNIWVHNGHHPDHPVGAPDEQQRLLLRYWGRIGPTARGALLEIAKALASSSE